MHFLAIIIGKLSKKILKCVGRGGSLPGEIALRFDKKFLKKVTLPQHFIIVTGTNGKSTVTNMIYKCLVNEGKSVICNIKGDNLKIGAVSLLLEHMNWQGKVQADYLVLEVDELSVPRIMEDVSPNYIVLNNFFRDQLDRAGEMENIVRKIEACTKDYCGTLVVNGNDPSCARIAKNASKANIIYFGIGEYEGSKKETNEASEGRFCPVCGKELRYSYYQYSHIGRFSCEEHFGNYAIDYEGNSIQTKKGTYVVNDIEYQSTYRTIYAFYNEIAVIALCSSLRLSNDTIKKTIASFKMNNGRMEQYIFEDGKKCILNLAKNPTGLNESMKYVCDQEKELVVGLVLNDLEADGHDVSWIYDADVELLCKENIKEIVTCGTRYLDMALRVQYASFKGKITPIDTLDDFTSYLSKSTYESVIIANYTSLQPTRRSLRRVAKCEQFD